MWFSSYPTQVLQNPNHDVPNNYVMCGTETCSFLGPLLWFNHGTHIPLVGQIYPMKVLFHGSRMISMTQLENIHGFSFWCLT